MPGVSDLAITRGANCISISTTSAPAALSRAMPSRSRTECGFERIVAQHRIGADLPEHQIRMRRKDVALKPRHHLRGLFAVDAAIEHRDVERRETLFQFDRKAARIACRGRTSTCPGGRRRTDRDNRQRLAAAAIRRAVCRSGLSKRASSGGVVHANVKLGVACGWRQCARPSALTSQSARPAAAGCVAGICACAGARNATRPMTD